MFHGTLSADVPVTCSVAFLVALPHPVPLPLITCLCVGSWSEDEVLLLPGFIGEWRGAELCKSHMHSVPVMGTSRTGDICLGGHTSIFGGQMAGLLLPPEKTEIIWAHHCVSECTYKGVGKVLWHHNIKERKNMKDRWREFYVQNLVVGRGGTHKPRIFLV